MNQQDQRQIQSNLFNSDDTLSFVGRASVVGGQVGGDNDGGEGENLIDDYSLKIVGISSMPNDSPSTKSKFHDK